MRYKQATLFRTPLKSDLSEVFDGFTSKQNYLQFLRGAYPNNYQVNSQIDFPLKAIKTRDLETTLVIPMSNEIIGSQKYYKDFNPLDWNYCAITYQYYDYTSTAQDRLVNDVKFYFITGAESLNDDPKRGTCKLYLTEDCWANYYLDFSGSNDTHYQFMHRSTQNNIANYSEDTANVITKGYPTSLRVIDRTVGEYICEPILCVAIRVSPEKITSLKDMNGNDVSAYEAMPSQRYLPVFYIPVVNTGNFGSTGTQIREGTAVLNFSNSLQVYDIPNIVNAVGVIDAWMTYYGADCTKVYDTSTTFHYTLSHGGKLADLSIGEYSARVVLQPVYSQSLGFINGTICSLQVSTNIDEIIASDECMCAYPFKSIELYNNGAVIPLNITESGFCRITVSRTNSTTPKLLVENGNNVYLEKLIANEFKIARVNDSLEVLLNNYGNQINSKYNHLYYESIKNGAIGAFGLFGTLISPAAGISTAIQSAGKLAENYFQVDMQNAQLKDADSALDVMSIPSQSGTDALFWDAVFIVNGGIKDKNTLHAYYADMHYKGNYYNQIEYLTKNYKEIFDYSETRECSIPQVKNPLARERIEQAYNRGITRFHIKTVDDELYDYVINMEKDVTNRSV